MATPDCPIYKEPCHEHGCVWYMQLIGKHPQKDSPVPEWGCAVPWIVVTNIEVSQRVVQLSADIEHARNVANEDAQAVKEGMLALANAAGGQMRDAIALLQLSGVDVVKVRRLLERKEGEDDAPSHLPS